MSASAKDERDPFKTVVSLLIATVTVTGALLAWRISVAGSSAGGLDSQGLAAALKAANTSTSISTYLYSEIKYFADYQRHLRMAALLETDASKTVDATHKAALYEDAIRERNLAAMAVSQVNPEYVRTDPKTLKESFDVDRYRQTQWAEARARDTLDSEASFAAADVKRNKTRALAVVSILFSSALFLLTASTATQRRLRYPLAASAVPLCLAGAIIVLVLETVW